MTIDDQPAHTTFGQSKPTRHRVLRQEIRRRDFERLLDAPHSPIMATVQAYFRKAGAEQGACRPKKTRPTVKTCNDGIRLCFASAES